MGEYGLEEPKDLGNNASFWSEHSPSTCCNKMDTEVIREKTSKLRISNSNISKKCADISTKNFWSLCDKGISTGIIQGLCPDQWSEWYDACYNDFFAGGMEIKGLEAGEISFWSKLSPTCTKVKHIYENPTDFCTQMGFTINSENDRCYDGIPWLKKPENAINPTKDTLMNRIFKKLKTLVSLWLKRGFSYKVKF